jgi:GR25 family glycosyltransferase involved in LPS biosynthesis
MKAYIIGDRNNQASVKAMNGCATSIAYFKQDFKIQFVQQTSPETLNNDINPFPGLKWNYPLNDESRVDEDSGMILQGYRTNSMAKVFSCLVSHARLWLRCVQQNESIMILEHDAKFIRKFDPDFEWEGGVLGLNDPRGATFNPHGYHLHVSSNGHGVHKAPYVTDISRPQGLAGNSAYIIKPFAATELLEKLKETGGWPNDALMCNQHFDWIKVLYPYATGLQNVRSTTTL